MSACAPRSPLGLRRKRPFFRLTKPRLTDLSTKCSSGVYTGSRLVGALLVIL